MQTVETTLFRQQITKGLLAFFLWGLLLLAGVAEAKQTMVATRVWPAEDYTRIALESGQAFNVSMHQLQKPDRIVLDLHGAVLDAKLNEVAKQVALNDPFIRRIRLGNFKPNVVRLVVDLKQPAKPKVFSIKPVAGYQHRLVLDLFPVNEDSLMAMLETRNTKGSKIIRKPTPNPSQRSNKVIPQRKLIVAIDAGHGGEDPGAIGATGSREKDLTLKIAKKLKRLIDKQPNMRAHMVRKGDYFIPLKGRVMKARKVHADIFVSIHADAFTKESAHGSSVFVLSERGASSKFAAQLAKQANASDMIGGFDLKNSDPILEQTIIDLMRTAMINDSLKLGREVLKQVGKINRLHKKKVEHANFVVLKAPDIPSILVETAFISNRAEERRLRSSKYQQRLAGSILKGIKAYFKTNPGLARINKPQQTLAAKK